jgi:hypothetical protein
MQVEISEVADTCWPADPEISDTAELNQGTEANISRGVYVVEFNQVTAEVGTPDSCFDIPIPIVSD